MAYNVPDVVLQDISRFAEKHGLTFWKTRQEITKNSKKKDYLFNTNK